MSDAPSAGEARILEMVFPEQTNHYGTLFGGQALRMMDMAAFVAASRHARSNVVTASSERVDFHIPVEHGMLAEAVARVTAVGRTSMTVEVDLVAENLLTGERKTCTQGRFVMVALDDERRPKPVPPLPGA
jgi:uncharacterized protein (TIGR00369 family)